MIASLQFAITIKPTLFFIFCSDHFCSDQRVSTLIKEGYAKKNFIQELKTMLKFLL